MNKPLKTDKFGIPIYSANDIIDLLNRGRIDLIPLVNADPTDPEVLKFNQVAAATGEQELSLYSEPDVTVAEFDAICQGNWHMPDEYKQLDIEQWLHSQIPPWDPECTRVNEELAAFKERNMLDLLRWLKYFVDTCRKHNVVRGVGRGSSVASYVLYLIGVHYINPITYQLDWREFLR